MSLLTLAVALIAPFLIVMKANSRAYLIFGRRGNPGIVRRLNRERRILFSHALLILSLDSMTLCFYLAPEWSKANLFYVFAATGLGCGAAIVAWTVTAARFYDRWRGSSGQGD